MAVRSQSLNLISLCSGGGGLDLGVQLAMPGARSVVLVEREAFAVSQLVSAIQQGLMAPAAIWSDVTTFNGRPWRGIVDGVIGGIPCQPHSLAGKRRGSDDERDLWSDARRIIVQSGAWFVLIENVPGMLSAKPGLDPGALRVRRDLQRLGFAVEAGLFTAAEVRSIHKRERLFILAVAVSGLLHHERWRRPGNLLCQTRTAEGQGHQRQWDGHAPNDRGDNLADTKSKRPEGRPIWDSHCEIGWHNAEQGNGRVAGIRGGTIVGAAISGGHDRRPDDEIGRPFERTAAERSSRNIVGSFGNTSIARGRRLPVQQGGQDEAGADTDRASLFPPGPSDLSGWAGVLASAPELEPAFRRVADGLASRLDVARVDRLRMLGNGVVPLEAAYALRTLVARLAAAGSANAAFVSGLMKQ